MWNRSKPHLLQQETGGWSNSGGFENYHDQDTAIGGNVSGLNSDLESHVQSLRELYEMRFQTLASTIREGYQSILSDDLLQTMKEDPVSEQFVHQRIAELFERIVFSEREVIIDKLSSQYSTLKAQYSALDNELRNEKELRENEAEESANVIAGLKEEALKERQSKLFFESELKLARENADMVQDGMQNQALMHQQRFQVKFNADAQELALLSERCESLELALQKSELETQTAQEEANSLLEELNEVRREFGELQVKEAACGIDLVVANERVAQQAQTIERINSELTNTSSQLKQALEKCSRSTKETEAANAHLNQLEAIYQLKYSSLENEIKEAKEYAAKEKSKHSEKSNLLKETVAEQRKQITDLQSSLATTNEQLSLAKNELHFEAESAQRNIQELHADFERKIRDDRAAMNAQMTENERRYEANLDEIERTITDRMNQSTQAEIENLRGSEKAMRDLLEEKLLMIQRDYISLQHHNLILAEKQSSLNKMKSDFDEFLERFKRDAQEKHSQIQQSTTATHSIELAAIKSSLKESEEQARQYKSQALQFDQKNVQLEATVSKLTSENEQRAFEFHQIESEAKRKEEKYTKLKARFDALEQTRDQIESSKSGLRADLEAARGIVKNIEGERQKLTEELLTYRHASEQVKLQLNESQRELSNQAAVISNHNSVLRFKDEIIASTKQQFQELKAENMALSTQFFELYNLKNSKSEEEQRRIEDMSMQLQKNALELQERSYQIDLLRSEVEVSIEARRAIEDQLTNLRGELLAKERELHTCERNRSEEIASAQKRFNAERTKSESLRQLLINELNKLKRDLTKLSEFVQSSVKLRCEETIHQTENIAHKSKDIIQSQAVSLRDHLKQSLSAAEHEFSQQLSDLQDKKNIELQEIATQADSLDQANQALLTENEALLQENNEFKRSCETLSTQNASLAKQNETNILQLQNLEQAFEQRISEFSRRCEESEQSAREQASREVEQAQAEQQKWQDKYILRDTQANQLESELALVRSRLEKHSRSDFDQQEKLRFMEQHASVAEKDSAEIRESMQNLIEELDETRRNMHAAQSSLENAQRQLIQTIQERDKLVQQNHALSTELKMIGAAHQQNSMQANLEIEELHRMLTQSQQQQQHHHLHHSSSTSSFESNLKAQDLSRKLDEETRQLTRKVVDIQHLNKLLEGSKSSTNLRTTPNKSNYFMHNNPKQPTNKRTLIAPGGEPNHTFAGQTTSNPSNASLMNISVERTAQQIQSQKSYHQQQQQHQHLQQQQQQQQLQEENHYTTHSSKEGTAPFYNSKSASRVRYLPTPSHTGGGAAAAAASISPYLVSRQMRGNQQQFSSHQQQSQQQHQPSMLLSKQQSHGTQGYSYESQNNPQTETKVLPSNSPKRYSSHHGNNGTADISPRPFNQNNSSKPPSKFTPHKLYY